MCSVFSKRLFLVLIPIIVVSGCVSRAPVIPAHYLVNNQRASGAFEHPLWLLNFDYFYRPANDENAEGSITIASTFTLGPEQIEAIHLQIVFIDAEGKILSKPEFQNITEFPANTIQNEQSLIVPAGAVGISFEGDTRWGRLPGDSQNIFGLP